MDPIKMKEVLEGVKKGLEAYLKEQQAAVNRIQVMTSDTAQHKKEMEERKIRQADQRQKILDNARKAGYVLPTE